MITTIALGISGLSLLTWLFLLLFWGQFWRCDQQLEPNLAPTLSAAGTELSWPAVAVIVPARNEAPVIDQSVRSLLNQDYPAALTVLLVDDQSDDGTAAIAQNVAQELQTEAGTTQNTLRVLSGQPLPKGWTGKLWALEQGTQAAQTLTSQPKYLLLTDADILHPPDNLRNLVIKAESEDLAMTSLMVKLRCQSFWERFLIPAFIFFFQKLYPFPWVNNVARRVAAAAGGCILVRRDVLSRLGGIGVVREALIDDCSLAAAVKFQDPALPDAKGQRWNKIWLGLSQTTFSLRDYPDLDSIWTMVARTAYTQLRYSPWLLLGTLIGMSLVYLAAPIGLFYGIWSQHLALVGINGLTWIFMAIAYGPTLKLYKQSPLLGFCLPAIALLYNLMTLDSARRHWQGQGGAWKGRVYGSAATSGS